MIGKDGFLVIRVDEKGIAPAWLRSTLFEARQIVEEIGYPLVAMKDQETHELPSRYCIVVEFKNGNGVKEI